MNEDIAGVTTRFFNSIFGGVALKALVPIVVGGFVEYCRQAYAPAPTPAPTPDHVVYMALYARRWICFMYKRVTCSCWKKELGRTTPRP